MNARTERQITEMKKQTIGVEVEMNGITRRAAAKVAPGSSEPAGTKTPPTATDTTPGARGTRRDASGSSRGTSASRDRTAKSANWSPRS